MDPEHGSLAEYFDGWYADMTGPAVQDEIQQRHLGLPAHLCVDAIHFAPQPDAAYGEIRRILTCGGRAVLTNWEPLECGDQRLPARLQRVDLGAGLTAAGFEAVEVRDRPGWRASERAMWQEAAALDPGDDPALRSFHDEGVRSLEIFGLVRRVIATATAP